MLGVAAIFAAIARDISKAPLLHICAAAVLCDAAAATTMAKGA